MRRVILFVMLIVFLTSTVSAEVWFTTQPDDTYSLGDNLDVAISVPTAGWQLRVDIICGNLTEQIFIKHLIDETSVDIVQPLTKSFLTNDEERCNLEASYSGDTKKSSPFTISSKVLISVEADKQDYVPGETIKIQGQAEKANTRLLDGFFEINFKDIEVASSGAVKNGLFQANLTLPENTAAGNYLFNITAFEKEGDETSNIGTKTSSINVKQVASEVEIALDQQEIRAGEELTFRVLLYDQAEQLISGEASYIIENNEQETLKKSLITIDESETFHLDKNLPIGYYKIKAYSSGVYGDRQFYVKENEEAEFEIINGTLMIRNVGNADYDNAIQVKIGNTVEIINTQLKVGEEKQYELIAPDGEYDVEITDGESSVVQDSVMLTGNAISLKERGSGILTRGKILAWVFLILVMGMFVFVASRRVLKKRFVLSSRREKTGKLPPIEKKPGVIKIKKDEGKPELKKELREAEHSLVLKGQKQDTPLIFLKLRNDLTSSSKENLNKILDNVHESGAVTYKTKDGVMILFSPLITKSFKNHIPAVKTALVLEKKLTEYNKKYHDKIDFGLSVHTGDIVNSIQEGKLRFTSLGNTTNIARKIADISKGEVLLSQDIHQKTLPSIKAEKQSKHGLDIFKVNRIVDTRTNKMFVNEFLKRMAEEGKKQGKK